MIGAETSPAPAPSPAGRAWTAVLAGVALACAVPMLVVGARARIEYDGWLHLFIARDESWSMMWAGILGNAHPPLFYLLLRAVSALGEGPLVFRSVSIAAAAVAVVALGFALRRVCRLPGVALAGALAFGLAIPTLVIAMEVRAYMLATAFLLLALPPYLELVRPGGSHRQRLLFVVPMLLSVLSEYAVLVVVCALVGAPFVVALADRGYRRAWRQALPRRWPADLATLLPLGVAGAGAQLLHLSRYQGPMNHLPLFYWSGDEPLWGFVSRTAVEQVALFSPVELAGAEPWALALAVGLAAAVPLATLALLRHGRGVAGAATLPATVVLLTLAHLALAILGMYPFGGALRHQYFVFPFALATLFVLADHFLARLRRVAARRLALAALLLAVVALWWLPWRRMPIHREELFAFEMALFRRGIPEAEAVYFDGFGVVPFYAHHHEWDWRPAGWAADDRLRLFRVSRGDQAFLAIFERSRWNPGAGERGLYEDLDAALEATGARSVAVVHLEQDEDLGPPTAEARRATTADLVDGARRAGLGVRRIVFDWPDYFALLEAAPAGARAAAPPPEVLTLADARLEADPNPIQVCGDDATGATTLSWSLPGRSFDLRIGAADGTLWATPPARGAQRTGDWVTDGMTFVAVDRAAAAGDPAAVLASVAVRHTDRGCPPDGGAAVAPPTAPDGSIVAGPNPIRVCDGAVGATTIAWSFPGQAIDIRLGAPDGPLWASPPPQGWKRTEEWVTDGMVLYALERDADPEDPDAVLASVEIRHTDRGCPP